MTTYNQHQINTAYNQLISNLVVWQYLTNKVKADTEQGYKVVKNQKTGIDAKDQEYQIYQNGTYQ